MSRFQFLLLNIDEGVLYHLQEGFIFGAGEVIRLLTLQEAVSWIELIFDGFVIRTWKLFNGFTE